MPPAERKNNKAQGRKRANSPDLDLENMPTMAELLGDDNDDPYIHVSQPKEVKGHVARKKGEHRKPAYESVDNKYQSRKVSRKRAAGGVQIDPMDSMETLLNRGSSSSLSNKNHEKEGRQQEVSSVNKPVPLKKVSRKGGLSRRATINLPKKVVMDGSNICRMDTLFDHSTSSSISSLSPLLELALFLTEKGIFFRCFFDASERFALARNPRQPRGVAAYNYLLRSGRKFFVEVSAGSSADDILLREADILKCPVVSNDRFNKKADNHLDQHVWLTAAGHRLIRAEQSEEDTIFWPALGLRVTLDGDPETLADDLLSRINRSG